MFLGCGGLQPCTEDAPPPKEIEGQQSRRPPPPPPSVAAASLAAQKKNRKGRRSSAGSSERWYPGKYLGKAARAMKSRKSGEGGPTSVADLFPATTRSLETYTEALQSMDAAEYDELEAWWVAAATDAETRRLADALGGSSSSSSSSLESSGEVAPWRTAGHGPRWGFDARLLHGAAGGVLRILLHFATEFLSNDAGAVVLSGCIGGDWDLPRLVRAFLNQIEGIMAMHPFWAAEAAAAVAVADSVTRDSLPAVTPRSSSRDGQRAAEEGTGLGGSGRGTGYAWESTCDELESFLFRKIGSIVMHALDAAPTLFSTITPQGQPPGDRHVVLSDRLSALSRWLTSKHLGVSWAGLDTEEGDWADAVLQLRLVTAGGAPPVRDQATTKSSGSGEVEHMLDASPRYKLERLVQCFEDISRTLVQLLERLQRKSTAERRSARRALKEEKSAAAAAAVAAAAAAAASASAAADAEGVEGQGGDEKLAGKVSEISLERGSESPPSPEQGEEEQRPPGAGQSVGRLSEYAADLNDFIAGGALDQTNDNSGSGGGDSDGLVPGRSLVGAHVDMTPLESPFKSSSSGTSMATDRGSFEVDDGRVEGSLEGNGVELREGAIHHHTRDRATTAPAKLADQRLSLTSTTISLLPNLPSADDVLPAAIIVLLRANPPRVSS